VSPANSGSGVGEADFQIATSVLDMAFDSEECISGFLRDFGVGKVFQIEELNAGSLFVV
jgi:hypothetical protein